MRIERSLASFALCLSLACGGTIANVGDGGTIEDAAQDHATEASPPLMHDAGHEAEAAPPSKSGSTCTAAGYHCAAEVASQCPTGSYPATPTTQDCPSGQLCCKQ
jgi:hypothetical protein